jgi:hypothetical protein
MSQRQGLTVPETEFHEKQAMLIQFISEGFPVKEACQKAGYKFIPGWIPRFLARPDVANAIETAVRAALRTQDRPQARATLVNFMNDTNLTPSTRIEAIKTLNAMIKEENERNPAGLGRSLSEMDGHELQDAIAKLQGEIANRSNGAMIINASVSEKSDIDILN